MLKIEQTDQFFIFVTRYYTASISPNPDKGPFVFDITGLPSEVLELTRTLPFFFHFYTIYPSLLAPGSSTCAVRSTPRKIRTTPTPRLLAGKRLMRLCSVLFLNPNI